jgi:hypothetical protein
VTFTVLWLLLRSDPVRRTMTTAPTDLARRWASRALLQAVFFDLTWARGEQGRAVVAKRLLLQAMYEPTRQYFLGLYPCWWVTNTVCIGSAVPRSSFLVPVLTSRHAQSHVTDDPPHRSTTTLHR